MMFMFSVALSITVRVCVCVRVNGFDRETATTSNKLITTAMYSSTQTDRQTDRQTDKPVGCYGPIAPPPAPNAPSARICAQTIHRRHRCKK